jgi:hypothetical protein
MANETVNTDGLGIMGEDLDSMVPQEVPVIFGKRKSDVHEFVLFPFALTDLSKVTKIVGKIITQFAKKEGDVDTKISQVVENFINTSLTDLTDIVALATFEPGKSVSNADLNKRSSLIMEKATLKQMVRSFTALFEINDVQFLLKNVTKLMGSFTAK